MKKKETDKAVHSHFRRVAAALYTILLIIFCCAGVQFFFHWSNNIQKERRTHLMELTGTLSELAEVSASSRKETVRLAASSVGGKEFENAEALFNALQEQKLFLGLEQDEVYVIDEDGTYFKADRTTGVWEDMEYLCEDSAEEYVWLHPVPEEEEKHLFYWVKLEKPVYLKEEHRSLEYYIAIIEASCPEKMFVPDAYAKKSSVYLLDSGGICLYCQNRIFDISQGDDFLQKLERNTRRLSGSWNGLKKAVSEDKGQYCMEISYQKTAYYLVTSPVTGIPDWSLLLVLQGDALAASGEGRNDCGNTLILLLIIILIVLIFITAILLVYLRRKEGTSKQQRESAKLFEQAAKEADRANRAKTELVAHISHDIRTPIGGVMGMTNIARRSIEDKEKVEDCLDKIEESSEYLLSLVNKVLELPKIENGELKMIKKPFSLPDLLKECIEMLEGQIKENKIWFYKKFSAFEIPVLLGDRLHIQQILMNILGNAVKFTPAGGQVFFGAAETVFLDGKVELCFTIEDTGIGMDAEFLKRIYEPYEKAEKPADKRYQGTGLGMTIVKQYIDAMGGSIQAESEPGKGSRFVVRIPLEAAEELPEKEQRVTVTKAFTGKKILVAEDVPIHLKVTVFLLESMGFTVETAVNGAEAVETFTKSKESEYAAILMDVMMPGMDGLEATEAIRKLNRADAANVPIVATTASIFEDDRTAILNAGMNGYLLKPLNNEAVYAEMMKWLFPEET